MAQIINSICKCQRHVGYTESLGGKAEKQGHTVEAVLQEEPVHELVLRNHTKVWVQKYYDCQDT